MIPPIAAFPHSLHYTKTIYKSCIAMARSGPTCAWPEPWARAPLGELATILKGGMPYVAVIGQYLPPSPHLGLLHTPDDAAE